MEKLGHNFIAHTEHLLQIWDETDPSPAGAAPSDAGFGCLVTRICLQKLPPICHIRVEMPL